VADKHHGQEVPGEASTHMGEVVVDLAFLDDGALADG